MTETLTAGADGMVADDRVTCQTCARLWRTPTQGYACTDHRRAQLTTRELAADFVALMQRCPAWSAKS